MPRWMRFGTRRRFTAFAANECGNVGIIFALFAIPIAGISAFAIDYGRASRVQSTLQRAGDAAAEALLPHLDAPHDHVIEVARTQLDANLPANLKNLPFTVLIAPDKSTIALSVQTEVPTSLAGVMGISSLTARSETNFRVPTKPILPAVTEVAVGSAGRAPARKPTDPEMRELQRQVELLERQLAGAINGGGLPPDVERLLRELSRR